MKKILIILLILSFLALGFIGYYRNTVFVYTSGNTVHLWSLNYCGGWLWYGEDEADCKSCSLGYKIRDLSWCPNWLDELTRQQSHCWLTTNEQESDAFFYYGHVECYDGNNRRTTTSRFIIHVYIERDENGNLKVKEAKLSPDMLIVPVTIEPKIWILN